MEQALTTLPKLMNWLPVFSEVHVTRSLVICVYIVDRCFSFCTFTFGQCVVCFAESAEKNYSCFVNLRISMSITFVM